MLEVLEIVVKSEKVDVVIVGSGPAGMASALYASRANLNTVIIERGLPGGEMQNTAFVENFPGFDKVSGEDLSDNMLSGALNFGAELIHTDVEEIGVRDNRKFVKIKDKIYETDVIILATGAKYKSLDIPGEEEHKGSGVSNCAVCDGLFFTNKDVVVVGGGDSAVEEGTYLAQFANNVNIVHRRDELRAQQILQERAKETENVHFIYNKTVEEIHGENQVEQVILRDTETGEEEVFPSDGVFVYIGFYPNSSLVEHLDITDKEGWVLTNEQMETTVSGLFAVGDVRKKDLRQIVTATGDGAIAGQNAYNHITNKKREL